MTELRRLTTLAVALLAAPWSASAGDFTKPMTPARVREAIAWGESLAYEKDAFDAYYLGGIDRLTVTTPFLRVAKAARKAREGGRPFTEGDVTPEMLNPVLHVHASGHLTGPNPFQQHTTEYTEAVNVEAVYILRPDGTRIDPLATRATPEQYRDEVSGTVEYRGMTAEFSLEALAPGNAIRVDLALKRSIAVTAAAVSTLR